MACTFENEYEFDAINKLVAPARGMKHVPRISKGQHEKVTVLACAAASGNSISPMYRKGYPQVLYSRCKKSGWIDKDLYLKWFSEVFLEAIPAKCPVLLIIDGHKAHVTQEVIQLAAANKILVFCLPALFSHLLQLLDLSLFGPLNRGWEHACAAFHHVTSTLLGILATLQM